jgi:hypothetical protein
VEVIKSYLLEDNMQVRIVDGTPKIRPLYFQNIDHVHQQISFEYL